MIARLIMFLCSIQCKKHKTDVLYIKGYEKDYPKYLIYSQNKNISRKMEGFKIKLGLEKFKQK